MPVGRPNPSEPQQKFADEFKIFIDHVKVVILIPLSWWLTLSHFVAVLTWGLLTLPLRISINFYERQIRRAFPWLPSIWGTLAKLFPEGIKRPSFTRLIAGPYKGEGPTGPNLPTFDNSAELDAIINGGGGESNGIVNGNACSPIESSRAKLETALKKISTLPPSDLDAGLADVKTAQAEAEKSLESLTVST